MDNIPKDNIELRNAITALRAAIMEGYGNSKGNGKEDPPGLNHNHHNNKPNKGHHSI